ncbi:hypothetical protein T02_15803 [Trichinella nativa]|uniref:Uncharacterized protein n=1 Tax=Trichinella nativa TaxID=6335 RepID=A0A0V1LUB1_9BILA|nr:hypothetical protein T02_15803 [Trichinella nativa]
MPTHGEIQHRPKTLSNQCFIHFCNLSFFTAWRIDVCRRILEWQLALAWTNLPFSKVVDCWRDGSFICCGGALFETVPCGAILKICIILFSWLNISDVSTDCFSDLEISNLDLPFLLLTVLG